MAITSPGSGAWRREARATLALGWPIVLTNVVQTAITASDVLMMGWLGPAFLAAGALGINLYHAMLLFGIGLVTASVPMIATELGARPWSVRDVRRTVRQALWACIAISLPAWAILWHTEAILVALGQNPEHSANAARFVRILMFGLPFTLGYIVLRSFVSALQRPLTAVGVGIFAVVFNAGLVYSLMFGRLGLPALGLIGAGIGSLISSMVMFAGMALVVSVDRRFRRYHLFGRFWRADWPRFRALFRLGLPIAVAIALEVTIFNGTAFLMGIIGTTSLAAYAIAIQIASLSFMVPLGFAQAATVRVGLALGAGDTDGIRRAGWTPFAMGIGFMTMMSLILTLFPTVFIGAFLALDEPANAETAAIAVSFIYMVALFQVVDGAQVLGSGMLRGLHDTRVPMVYALVGFWVLGLPSGALLAFYAGFGGIGLWLGLFLGLAIVSGLMLWRWLHRRRLGLEVWAS
jgi:MATE family multidrug resistance protein